MLSLTPTAPPYDPTMSDVSYTLNNFLKMLQCNSCINYNGLIVYQFSVKKQYSLITEMNSRLYVAFLLAENLKKCKSHYGSGKFGKLF